jgi:hypothetical protein
LYSLTIYLTLDIGADADLEKVSGWFVATDAGFDTANGQNSQSDKCESARTHLQMHQPEMRQNLIAWVAMVQPVRQNAETVDGLMIASMPANSESGQFRPSYFFTALLPQALPPISNN